ncbi:MAG: hypothetical protein RJA49_663 [Actinomycetota bacterium]
MQTGHRAVVAAVAALSTLGLVGQPAAAGPARAVDPPTAPAPVGAAVAGRRAEASVGLARLMVANPRMTVAAIRATLADPTTWVQPDGHMYAVDQFATAAASTTSGTTRALLPLAQTFLLQSRPGSHHTIYLDFRGGVTASTLWNQGAPIAYEPFDMDGDLASFSTLELGQIQEAWAVVAEDFAPFDVNVTTKDPGAAAIDRTGPADVDFGTRAVITQHNEFSSTCGCSGIAFLGAFADVQLHSLLQPAWIFNSRSPVLAAGQVLGKVDNGHIAGAVAAHEIGHTFGLQHDGKNGSQYYSGQGIWSPIMGNGIQAGISQWSNGDYALPTNTEDDFAVIAAGGAPLLPDTVGNSALAPTALPAPPFDVGGLLSPGGDVDVYSVVLPAGPFTASVLPAETEPDADLRLTLGDSNGAPIATDDPVAVASTLRWGTVGSAATVSATIATAGTYTLSVRGVGNGDPLTTGYSSYGSAGRYRLLSGLPTVTVASSGDGTVASADTAIQCGATCAGAFVPQATVTLTATPGVGAAFGGWTGGGCDDAGTGPCTFEVTAPVTVSAPFGPGIPLTLTASNGSIEPFSLASVRAAPGDVTCDAGGPASCVPTYTSGTVVTLTAVPDTTTSGAAAFSHWSGDCLGTAPTCTVTMDQARSVHADFVPGQQLFISTNNFEVGRVRTNVPGVSCPGTGNDADCFAAVATNTVVTLTAAPLPNGVFTGWSGACTGTVNPCVVTMNAAKSVDATFAYGFTVAVSKSGSGAGTIVSTPAKVSCGAVCKAVMVSGTTITLTAVAASGSKFVGWSGTCAGKPAACSIPLNGSVTTNAIFESIRDTFRRPPQPIRLLDTRAGSVGTLESFGDVTTPLPAFGFRSLDLTQGGVPLRAPTALQITTINPAARGELWLYGCSAQFALQAQRQILRFEPGVSTTISVMFEPDALHPNLCIVPTAATHVTIDTNGWFPTTGTFVPLIAGPLLVDTAFGVKGALEPTDIRLPFAANSVHRFVAIGKAGVPLTGARAIALEVESTTAGAGSIRVYPCASVTTVAPAAISASYHAGRTGQTMVITNLTTGGFCVRTTSSAGLRITARGWIRTKGGYGTFATPAPAPPLPRRLVDTRPGVRGLWESTVDDTKALAVNAVRRYQVAGRAGVPLGIGSAVLTFTSPAPAGSGTVQAWACDAVTVKAPATVALSYKKGAATNTVIVPVSANGGICVRALTVPTHLIIDTVGWFTK